MKNIEKIKGRIGVKIKNEYSTIEVLTMINGRQWSGFPANIELLVMLRAAIDEYMVQHGNIEAIKHLSDNGLIDIASDFIDGTNKNA
jgi:hypothetical protein